MADVTIRVDRKALRAMLSSPGGQVARGMYKLGKKVERRAKRLCPVDEGNLRNSITTELVIRGATPVARVGTNVKYALWVHEGTGIYGPRGVKITPKKGKVLVFKPRGSAKLVFAKSVKGMRGTPYLRDALHAVV